METIFDHKPTAEELSVLFLTPQVRERYIATATSQDCEFEIISSLYSLRGDKRTEAKYAKKIRDPFVRLSAELHDVVDG